MEFKYKLSTRVELEIDGQKVSDTYAESGESFICDDVGEYIDMFVKPRFDAAGFVSARRLKNKVGNKEEKDGI
ncbi:hypothetical protein LCGC14_1192750 [marine sediment metagenome]|uniref:Uncharacterized protein n=1 Tax=marine sediment metagenome TaxID=412755 RepID=A0A0F9PP86_9ZZZZ